MGFLPFGDQKYVKLVVILKRVESLSKVPTYTDKDFQLVIL